MVASLIFVRLAAVKRWQTPQLQSSKHTQTTPSLLQGPFRRSVLIRLKAGRIRRITIVPNMKPRIGVLPVVIAALGGKTSCGEILKTGQLMTSLRLRLVVLAEVAARSRSVLIRLIGRIR